MTLLSRLNAALAGLAALPEMAEILPSVVDALNRWRSEEATEIAGRFVAALRNLGVTDEAAIARFLAGTDTEEDHCTARELEEAERWRLEHANSVELTKEIHSLKHQLSAANETIDELESENASLKAERDDARARVFELDGQLDESQTELKSTNKTIDEGRLATLKYERQYSDTYAELVRANETIDALTRWLRHPCTLSQDSLVEFRNPGFGPGVCYASEVEPGQEWRHTPESWQAVCESREERGYGKRD